MKILDRYILTTYLKTFISVFIILILIFILQSIWLYIKELAGKDLYIVVILKFIAYVLPKLIPLVLPLTILLSSIMVFGSFAENYEFAAMKSTGISLQRAMSSLSVFIVGLGIVTFFFANNVIPWAEFNFLNLRKNIAKSKPAAGIAEGQFNDIGNYNIKVEEKVTDKDLKNVTIHIKGSNNRTNSTTIKSKTGEFISDENSNVLKLVLYDGNYYNDLRPSRPKPNTIEKKPFAKSTFEKYTINIDLSELNNVDFDDKSSTDRYNMLNVSGLNKTIDSLVIKRNNKSIAFSKILQQRSGITKEFKPIKKELDSLYKGTLLDIFDTKNKVKLLTSAVTNSTSAKKIIATEKDKIKKPKEWLNKHIISLHEKFALGLACIILFFVGAPLGALIRKGGIGLPMVIAILLFLTYHFIGIFATNSAKTGNFSPVIASWFSTLVMLPLGVFLTKRATADRKIFEGEGLFELLKKLFRIKKKDAINDISTFNELAPEFITLNSYDNNKLIKIAKNYRQFNYKVAYRNSSLKILNSRGITNEQLKFAGNFNDQKVEQAINLKNKFEEDAKLTFILYITAVVIGLTGAILENNKFETIGTIKLIVGLFFEILFFISLVKTAISESNYRKYVGKSININYILLLVLGLPLYFIVYFFQKKEFEKDLLLNNSEDKSNEQNTNNRLIDENTKNLHKNYDAHSKFAIVLYSVGIILLVLHFVFKNNKLPSLASASIELSMISLVLFIIYYFKSLFNLSSFYKKINKKEKSPNLFILIIGFPIYILVYPFLNVKIKEDLK